MRWECLNGSKKILMRPSKISIKSIREGTNKRIDGEAYLKLGEIYYDTLEKL